MIQMNKQNQTVEMNKVLFWLRQRPVGKEGRVGLSENKYSSMFIENITLLLETPYKYSHIEKKHIFTHIFFYKMPYMFIF